MALEIENTIAAAVGLGYDERPVVRELVSVWRKRKAKNELRERYYLEHVTQKSLGISVPPKLNVKASCGWPRKAVDYIAFRSQFDGFTTADEDAAAILRDVVAANDLKNAYHMAVTSQLVHCFTMLSVTKGDVEKGEPKALVTVTPATAAAGIWDDRARQIGAGLCVVQCERKNEQVMPIWVDVFMGDRVLTLKRHPGGGRWRVTERQQVGMGRSLMEPMANEPTLMCPFGRSLITRSVRQIADNYLRESVRSEVAAEFSASPQKYLLGASKKALADESKYDAYIGSILAVSKDRDGDVPTFGQLAQPSMEPHISYVRSLAAQFSGETNVPLSALGVVSDNPSSAEAIYATKEDAVIQVQRINAVNKRALVNVGWMALAIVNDSDYKTERERVPDLNARFANPAMPSVVSRSDAMVKQIGAIPWLGESDVALEELGYDEEQIQRLQSDKRASEGKQLVNAIVGSKSLVAQAQALSAAPVPQLEEGGDV